ncbi:MAG: hydantoinase/oxoprolinase family protein, partial [Candidatus Tectomicrobia bacterium]|nr:hydantoinase/oxoprolinase family protein [Candidatus Tectomicrobia bacterium]
MPQLLGVDVGGTFTDLVLLDEESGTIRAVKVLTTPGNQGVGLLQAIQASGGEAARIATLLHGTTVATNAIIERKGAACGLLTTKGFRDILELRRKDRPALYGLKESYEPLISREWRLEVDERVDAKGTLLKEVKEKEIVSQADQLLKGGVEALVISFLHSYLNPENEKKAKEILKKVWPNNFLLTSHEILPEIGEFERTSTVAASAYVQPLISRYVESLLTNLKASQISGSLLFIDSEGGIMHHEEARSHPLRTILSGPAAGVTAAAAICRQAGYSHFISCDMGGTSFDVAVAAGRNPLTVSQKSLSFGLPITMPLLDITTIGAGGGSIARVDEGGLLQVGPESAGAFPGPACYGNRGTRPTVTDANLILGRMSPTSSLLGEKSFALNHEAAREAIWRKIALPLRLSVEEAASAMTDVVNEQMAGSIRLLTIERGIDPSEFVLVAYGGAGPLHAAFLAKELGLSRVLVPHYAGVFSALGCVMANVKQSFHEVLEKDLHALKEENLRELLQKHKKEGEAFVARHGIAVDRVEVFHELEMAYRGQAHTIRVVLNPVLISRDKLGEAFQETYLRLYSELPDGIPIFVRKLNTLVVGMRNSTLFSIDAPPTSGESMIGTRSVYFDGESLLCKVHDRAKFPLDAKLPGPVIIEEPWT